ncbi:acyl-CoA carboxylase subunit beta [Yinghuangia seranimata]|uniref:acyl-CoA carboxylase subunit beta n=1 Tax=Yinghuangia seranimata TaxID=408067 RepID=UPI00248B3AED|nr:carboxyl transferase domain-containing protein [Yinghuangia seranimata]MDI2124519.1 carboxyl transferase domain-containing protein [Yinghuangia seranimata]
MPDPAGPADPDHPVESPHRAAWRPLRDDLARRRTAARAMGGPAKLARYTAGGRLTARARVDALLDPGSFTELGTLAGGADVPADAFVAGSGRVDGRPVFVGAEDFTVQGGSIGPSAAAKRARLARLAGQERAPLVMLLEGAGHRATNALQGHTASPNDLQALTELAGVVPTVAVVTGPSAGHGALTAPLSDFVVMVAGEGALFTAGPPLVAAAIGEQVDKLTLGGADVHTVLSGVAHNAAPDDAAALRLARRYLSYLPSNAWQRPPYAGPEHGNADTGPRPVDALLDLIPPDARRPYDMRAVLETVFDAASVLELQPRFGASVLTALARLGGHAVAVVANQPAVRAGTIDADAAAKAARFVEVCGAFHLPVVFLADNPGVLAGSASERAGILRASARLFAAQHRLRVPKLHVTLRKAFGFGSSVMAMNPFDAQTVSYAFPGVTLGGIPAASGAATAKQDAETSARLVANEASGPWRSANALSYDDVIDPAELRDVLLEGLARARARTEGPVEPVTHTGYLP